MIIVGGIFEVDPAERDVFLASRHEAMRTSRAEHGCIDYVFGADPIEPNRVVLFERWETQADLDAHLARLRAEGGRPGGVQPLSAAIEMYTAEPIRRD
jgi:quinol monooxygenase YgiN